MSVERNPVYLRGGSLTLEQVGVPVDELNELEARVEELEEKLAGEKTGRDDAEIRATELAGRVEELERDGSPGVMHEVDKAFYELTVAQRNHAWEESARRLRRLNYTRDFFDDLKHLRCEDDCEGFRDPCAACVVHEARARLGPKEEER